MEAGRWVAQGRLTHMLGVEVQIRKLTFSPTHLTLYGVTFHPDPASTRLKTPSAFEIQRLQLKGSLGFLKPTMQAATITGIRLNIAGVPLEADGRFFVTTQPDDTAKCDGRLAIKHAFLSGEVEVSGAIETPVFLGWLEGLGQSRRHFVGQLGFSDGKLQLSRLEVTGGWRATGQMDPAQRRGSLEVVGLNSRYTLQVEGVAPVGGKALLWLYQEDLIPQELSMQWQVKRSALELEASFLSERIRLSGQMDLAHPYSVDLNLLFRGANVMDLADWIFSGADIGTLSGRLSGAVQLSGTPPQLDSKGELIAQNVLFGIVSYPRMALRFEGAGPLLKIANSQLTRPNGILLAEGTVDLRRVGRNDFFRGVKLTSMEKTLEMAGWEMSPAKQTFYSMGALNGSATGKAAGGVQVRQANPDDPITVGFSYGVDAETGPEAVTRERVAVEYALSPEEHLELEMDSEGTFVGIEHRERF